MVYLSGCALVHTVFIREFSWLDKHKVKILVTTVYHSLLTVLQFLSLYCKVCNVTHIS